MKKLMVFAVLLAAIVMVSCSTAVLAGSMFCNARADLQVVLGKGVDSASGHTIINYAKGQAKWVVQVIVRNLAGDTNYKVQVGEEGTPLPQADLGIFKTDANGNANFHTVFTDLETTLAQDTYSIVRIIDLDDLTPDNPGCGGTIVMVAKESTGDLQFRGDKRGK